MTGYGVDPDTLRSASKKITDSVKGVDDVKVGNLGENPGDFGHSEAQDAFSQLMATWNQALTKKLKTDAEASAEKLKSTAANYEAAEARSDGAFAPSKVGLA
jgi:hypothetical protein